MCWKNNAGIDQSYSMKRHDNRDTHPRLGPIPAHASSIQNSTPPPTQDSYTLHHDQLPPSRPLHPRPSRCTPPLGLQKSLHQLEILHQPRCWPARDRLGASTWQAPARRARSKAPRPRSLMSSASDRAATGALVDEAGGGTTVGTVMGGAVTLTMDGDVAREMAGGG